MSSISFWNDSNYWRTFKCSARLYYDYMCNVYRELQLHTIWKGVGRMHILSKRNVMINLRRLVPEGFCIAISILGPRNIQNLPAPAISWSKRQGKNTKKLPMGVTMNEWAFHFSTKYLNPISTFCVVFVWFSKDEIWKTYKSLEIISE